MSLLDEDGHRIKRFKFQSYNDQLNNVHLPSVLSQDFKFNDNDDINDQSSTFYRKLTHLLQLNLGPSFVAFAHKALPLSQSLPLLILHWRKVVDLWKEAVNSSDAEGLNALFDLMQTFIEDLRSTLAPAYDNLLDCCLQYLIRTISPESLTALLSTLSTLFKHVLVPSTNQSHPEQVEDYSLLDSTWTKVSNSVLNAKAPIRIAIAEVWASVLRRLRQSARFHCVKIMLTSVNDDGKQLDTLQQFLASCFVLSMKSVAHSLHTCTNSLLACITEIDFEAEPTSLKNMEQLFRRTLTALIHHCSSADQFSVVSELLIDNLIRTIDKHDSQPSYLWKLNRVLQSVGVICAVRKGARLQSKQPIKILTALERIEITPVIEESLMKVTVACLTSSMSDMALSMGPGRRILERAWAYSITYALRLSGNLADLDWDGFKSFALPLILKLNPSNGIPEESDLIILRLLSKLSRNNLLVGTQETWKENIDVWLRSLLETFAVTEDFCLKLQEMLPIIAVLEQPLSMKYIVKIVDDTLKADMDPHEKYELSWANDAWVLGACLSTLAEVHQAPNVEIDHGFWLKRCLQQWSWSEFVFKGLVDFVKSIDTNFKGKISIDDILPSILECIMSHSHSIRLSALTVLTYSIIDCASYSNTITACLDAEAIPLSVQGARERSVRISKVSRYPEDANGNTVLLCIRWLIGQLKANLQPLWKPSIEAIAKFSSEFPDVVWNTILQQIEVLCSNKIQPEALPPWVDVEEPSSTLYADDEEKTWRDPSLAKLRASAKSWIGLDDPRRIIIGNQRSRDRFDVVNYQTQLLATLEVCSALAERHSRELVPLFLSSVSVSSKMQVSKPKLIPWLRLFSKFTNPKAMYNSSTMHEIYTSLLAHPDKTLQNLALTCLLCYKTPSLASFEEKLRSLLDDSQWRDAISSLEVGKIESKDRPDVIPVIIRLLYGAMLEKKGQNKNVDRRAAALSALGGCHAQELSLLIQLMLGPFLVETSDIQATTEWTSDHIDINAPERRHIGFLIFLGDVLKILGTHVIENWPQLIFVTLALTANAQSKLEAPIGLSQNITDEEVVNLAEDIPAEWGSSRTYRTIRVLGTKRLADFFRFRVDFNFEPYMPEIFRKVISPRMPSFNTENVQTPSALMELLNIWTQSHQLMPFLVRYDDDVLRRLYGCLATPNIKPIVINRIFDMAERILAEGLQDQTIMETILKPYISYLLSNLTKLMQNTLTTDQDTRSLGFREVSLLSQTASFLNNETEATLLLELLSPLLLKSPKLVSDKMKSDILSIMPNLFRLIPQLSDSTSSLHQKIFNLLSKLFQTLKDRRTRGELVAAFQEFAHMDKKLESLAELVYSLNSYSKKRIDEPDFDSRLSAFGKINETLYLTLSVEEWSIILNNMLYLIQDENELSMRTNAALALKRFVDVLCNKEDEQYRLCFSKIWYPSLKGSLRSRSDLVRSEVLGVLAYAITKCDHIASFQEMRVLLADGDQEANFFNNILHIQIHRRMRALHRLAEYCDKSPFRSGTLNDIFVPLIASFIQPTSTLDHHLVNEAILTMGRIAKHLEWNPYYSLIQSYLRRLLGKNAIERVHVRALVATLESFHFSMETVVKEEIETAPDDNVDDEDDSDDESAEPKKVNAAVRIADIVNRRLLPRLLKFLQSRDEVEDLNRIPIATGIATVASHLPSDSRELQISQLFTVLCQVFRSKSQETRDLARETLYRIVGNLGIRYLSPVMKELRSALLRGPHLHVLAFVTHALLVYITTRNTVQFEDLDACVSDVAYISSEVIFGRSGEDVQSEGFKTKMKEVRTSAAKGLDSFGIVAKHITPNAISSLLLPLKAIMQETEAVKTMQQVDEVLKRITGGLNSNSRLSPADLLVLCHTLISQNAKFLQEAAKVKAKKKTKGIINVTVELKRKNEVENHYAHNSYRFVCFGLDMFNTAHRRGRFDFHDPHIISRLEPMVAVIGNTLYSSNDHVVSLGLKASVSIVKCPLKSLDSSLPVFVKQTLEIMKRHSSTESEIMQIAIKSLAVILRDCASAKVKEKDLTYLLELITPDLEEPSRQGTAFSLIRGIISRKFVVAEIYDIMDRVSEIMVTSQTTQVQELCRVSLLQFLLDYPQGKGRLRNQMSFLVKNLSYVYENGRLSVMELLNAVIQKFSDELMQEYADLLFIGLVMALSNDESVKCREKAAGLVKSLLGRIGLQQKKTILSHVHSWAKQKEKPALGRVSCQVYGLMLDVLQKDESLSFLSVILEDVQEKIKESALLLDDLDDSAAESEEDINWQTPYQALTTLSKIFTIYPSLVNQPFSTVIPSSEARISWSGITVHLLHSHTWVRNISCRLLGTLFTICPITAPKDDIFSDNNDGADSLLTLSGMKSLSKTFCEQLKSEHLDEQLGLQIVKNLFFIGKCFSAMAISDTQTYNREEEGASDDDTDNEDDDEDNDNEKGSADDESDVDGKSKDQGTGNPLPWLFSRLSFQARSAHILRRNKQSNPDNWSQQILAVLRWFAGMTSYLDGEKLERYLPHILSPVYRIIEDDTVKDAQMTELNTTAIELQDLVQAKVGTTKFSAVYNIIRQKVMDVRQERKTTRILQTTTNPQLAAKRKIQRNVSKKENRKRKNRLFTEGKIKNSFAKRRRVD